MAVVFMATADGAARRGAAAVALIGLLAGCHHRHRGIESTPPPRIQPIPAETPAASTQSDEDRYVTAVTLLEKGSTAEGRKVLAALVDDRPGDRHARQLLNEVDTDAHALYGNESYAYTVQPGDALVAIAHRLLKDADQFYGLARYNGLTFPVELKAGQVLQIPGRPPEAPRPTPAPAPVPRRPAVP
ncbi:LysM peptidoglycan-binding domain-containing protein, partial [Sphingomonas bacterium]|uniref:LysM peptidoglycan-binding domain-containing protein n=1 Tax=Sphingomonas bacterium TaxID=1895847 RepID=UPI00157713B0